MDQITMIVNEFLRWPLPESVCSDQCATVQGYPNRTGTNLLTANEARQMFEYILGAIPRADSRFEVAATNAAYKRAERAERQLAERDAELAAIKGHASAMHKVLSWLDATGGKGLREHEVMREVLDAYRTAYKE